MTKISKKDLKRPDQLQAELIRGFKWTTSHSKLVLGCIGVFLVAAAAYSITSYVKSEKEIAVQEKYYTLEKQYTEKRSGFEQALQQQDKKDAKAPEASIVAASGDLQKDYGTVVDGMEALIKDSPKSRGAQMASLILSEIYLNYKKPEDGLRALKSVEPGLGGSVMLTSLVLNQIGNVYAEQNDCKQAVDHWQKIVENKKLVFAHDEARLRMGICYESLGDPGKAEDLYSQVSKKDDKAANLSAPRDAEKYLRLLKMKKNLAGSGT